MILSLIWGSHHTQSKNQILVPGEPGIQQVSPKASTFEVNLYISHLAPGLWTQFTHCVTCLDSQMASVCT